jgi:hypothetical protein
MATILSAQVIEAQAMQKPVESAAVARVRMILQLNDEERVQALGQEGNSLMDELGALNESELMRSMLGSLSGMLLDRTSRKRLATARTLNTMRRGLERAGTVEVEDAFEISVRTALDVEHDPNVYSVLADMMAFIADLRIRRGKVDRAREILELLHRHYQIKDPSFPQRSELAYIALERVASGVDHGDLFPPFQLFPDPFIQPRSNKMPAVGGSNRQLFPLQEPYIEVFISDSDFGFQIFKVDGWIL